jgi:two-component system CheB/CheR fusion protein
MPKDTGMAFVVVTHQHPAHRSLLPELLAKSTVLPVIPVTHGMRVRPDHVYVETPGAQLAILNGVLHRMETDRKEAPRQPIDYFFRSLAEDQKDRAIGIILSGTGTDGTLGLKAIKSQLGMAMVQQAQTAKYAGMPSSAVAAGQADYVLPPPAMPGQLMAYVRGSCFAAPLPSDAPEISSEPLRKIFLMLRSRTGHDFSAYKATTIRRRIDRRMNLHQIKGLNSYIRYLQENPHELDVLFKELLISVTSFFRDPEAFDALAESVLPDFLKDRPDNYVLRAWVPGCSTGEEAYSIAILLQEAREACRKHFAVQIFGTDLDKAAIEAARNGIYPAGISVDVAPRRLDRCFVYEDGGYRVCKEIRETTIFATQNVVRDPPFTRLDLISCRNLLIYLNAELQRRLLPLFHYALKPGGLLLLGPSESIGGLDDLFEVVDKKWKIYRRKETALATHPVLHFPSEPRRLNPEERAAESPRAPREANVAPLVEQLLLARFAPASVVVNDRGDIAYIHGRTGNFLEPASGHPRLNLLDMAREGLQLELSSALRQAATQNIEILREGVRVRTNGGFTHVNITVMPIHDPEPLRGLLLVTVRVRPASPQLPGARARRRAETETSRVAKLERELQRTRESLQTTIEELETANEELKSTNQELQSTNEELQSTNEELETSKEEMQSLNEELTTVNTEMQAKVEELSRATDDMQNLLNSTEIATLFLDDELNIKRYTEQIKGLIHVISSDVGRPLGDLVSNLSYDRLVADCREVLRTLSFKQVEVRIQEGHWYLMRIMPYRTADNAIDGLVLTFVDINPVKQAQRDLRRMSKVFLDGLDPIMILDLTGRILDMNDEAGRTYGWTREELLGRSVKMIVPKAYHSLTEERLNLSRSGECVRNVECLRITKSGREMRGLMTFSLLTDESGQPEAISMITKHFAPEA